MQSTSPPAPINVPFANSGTKNAIPVTTGSSTAASLQLGFPPATFQSVSSGGTPPAGADFNGAFNLAYQTLQWAQAGGTPSWNSAFSTAIGGYPKNARLASAAADGNWMSLVENNTTNPDAGGAGWAKLSALFTPTQTGAIALAIAALFQDLPLDVKNWGCACDAQHTNAAVAYGVGSPYFTTSSLVFKSSDVGKKIYISGAGVGGGTYAGTIQTVVYGGQVTISPSTSTAMTVNCDCWWGTDDSASLQSAIDNVVTAQSNSLLIPGMCLFSSLSLPSSGTAAPVGFTICGRNRQNCGLVCFSDNAPIVNFTVENTRAFLLSKLRMGWVTPQGIGNTASAVFYVNCNTHNLFGVPNWVAEDCSYFNGRYVIAANNGTPQIAWGFQLRGVHIVDGGFSGGYIELIAGAGMPCIHFDRLYLLDQTNTMHGPVLALGPCSVIGGSCEANGGSNYGMSSITAGAIVQIGILGQEATSFTTNVIRTANAGTKPTLNDWTNSYIKIGYMYDSRASMNLANQTDLLSTIRTTSFNNSVRVDSLSCGFYNGGNVKGTALAVLSVGSLVQKLRFGDVGLSTSFAGAGSTATNVLTVTATSALGLTSSPIRPGDTVLMPNAPLWPPGVTIVSQLSGTTGGIGTYQLSQSVGTFASQLVTTVGFVLTSQSNTAGIAPGGMNLEIESWSQKAIPLAVAVSTGLIIMPDGVSWYGSILDTNSGDNTARTIACPPEGPNRHSGWERLVIRRHATGSIGTGAITGTQSDNSTAIQDAVIPGGQNGWFLLGWRYNGGADGHYVKMRGT